MTDFTKADLEAIKGDGKFGDAPPHDAPVSEIAAFLTVGYGLPARYSVCRVVRYGGRAGTGLTVFIRTPAGKELRVNYERESDCISPARLRAQAAGDTNGLTRATRINSPKAALAMYEAMCSLADNFDAADLRGQTWEWVQQLQQAAATTTGSLDSYHSLRRLQKHEYSKRLVQDPPRDDHNKPIRPVPILLVDNDTGHTYVTARHMAVFLRYELGVEDAGTDDRILTRLSEIGGERRSVEVWDSTGRDRTRKIRLVLYRLPEDADVSQ